MNILSYLTFKEALQHREPKKYLIRSFGEGKATHPSWFLLVQGEITITVPISIY